MEVLIKLASIPVPLLIAALWIGLWVLSALLFALVALYLWVRARHDQTHLRLEVRDFHTPHPSVELREFRMDHNFDRPIRQSNSVRFDESGKLPR
jgi:hypothetical protein